MKRPSLFLLFFIFSFVCLLLFVPKISAGKYVETEMDKKKLFKVVRVVDGDTIVASIRGNNETIRLLGIDTPETVDPRKTVQCFGEEASNKMREFVDKKFVKLIDDPTQGNRDKYRRLLRYVYLPDSKATFVNGEMVKQGYAFSYRQYPTKMLSKFNYLEKYARENNLGLWGGCPLNPSSKAVNSVPVKGTKTTRQTNNNSSFTGEDKDCGDFKTHAEAQAFFISQGGPGSDPHRLDADHDGQACESLP